MVDGIAALELLVVFAEVLRSVVLDRALDNGHVGVEEVPLPLPIVEVRRGEGLVDAEDGGIIGNQNVQSFRNIL